MTTGRPARSPTLPRLFSAAEVALQLGVSEKTVRRLIADGQLATHRVGPQIRIADADVAAFLARSRRI